MIDLSRAAEVLAAAQALLDDLHGQELDEADAITSQSKGGLRQQKARLSQDLQLLAHRLEAAATLVREEYWAARGKPNLLNDRTGP